LKTEAQCAVRLITSLHASTQTVPREALARGPSVRPKALLIEAVRSGTIASMVIVPLAPLFRATGLRVGHYGPKFAALFFDDPQPWLLFAQHLVIGWVSALPLLLILVRSTVAAGRPWITGATYGAMYYAAVNSLALPLYFGDATPWQLGWSTVYPSLLGHMIYGMSIGWTSKRFVAGSRAKSNM
jgi:uncharacterized membrane protein YagU involved in acid resistance